MKDSRSNSAEGQKQHKLLAAAVRRLESLNRKDAFDPVDPESRPTAPQQEVIDDFGKVRTQWIVAGNQSGKSQTCARLVSWVAEDMHPTWKRPAAWSNEALLILICARTGKQIEESLWPKIKSYLSPGTYKEVRLGNILQRVELENGNRLVFQSLENPNVAAERIQSYVAHLVWIDEMPPTEKVLSEAMVRRNTRDGYFLASFTPLVVNEQIKRMVDAADGEHTKKYTFRMFDNPAYSTPERQQEILASMAHLPQHVRDTRLYGAWSSNDQAVYHFHYEKMVIFPQEYSRLWRHVESVDPAIKSALGYTLWAEDPKTAMWYCVKAKYFRGIYVPTDLVEAVRQESDGFNIVRRISDPHEAWYIHTAASRGISYMGVHKKNERKQELIKQLQQFLGQRILLSPDCTDLQAEFQECRWSDSAEGKIVNASSYHLLDSAQYFCDNIPKPEQRIHSTGWEDYLYKANRVRLEKQDKLREKQEKMVIRRGRQLLGSRGQKK